MPKLIESVPLNRASLCNDCERVVESLTACPLCGSSSLLILAVVLDRGRALKTTSSCPVIEGATSVERD